MIRHRGSGRIFEFFVVAALVSKLGNQLLYLTVPLAVYQSTGSGALSILIFAVQSLPFVASPFLGVVIDRYSRLVVFGVCELAQAVAIAALALTLDSAPIGLSFLLVLIASTASVMSNIIVNFVLIPALVPAARLPSVNGIYTASSQLIALVGLPLGGLIYAGLGARPTLFIDAASFVLTIAMAVLITPSVVPAGTRRAVLHSVAEGWRFLRADRLLFGLTCVLGLCNLGAGSLAVVVLQTAVRTWHFSDGLAGLAMGVGAAGTALGALAGSKRGSDRPFDGFTRALVIYAGGAALLLAGAGSPAILGGFFVLSVGEGVLNVRSIQLRQQAIPSELAGRINTIIRMIIIGAVPLSGVIAAPLGQVGPAWKGLVPAACGVLALGVWLRLHRSRPINDPVSVQG